MPHHPPYCGDLFPNCTVPARVSPSSGPPPFEWRLVPQRGATAHGKCPSGGSFVSLISNDLFLDAALCLPKQLQQHGSTCPFALVYDADFVSRPALDSLKRAHVRVLPLQSLIQRAEETIRRVQGMPLAPKNARARHLAGRLTSNTSFAKLHRSSLTVAMLHKVWMWALPPSEFPMACFIDLDVLVRSNLDPLLDATTVFRRHHSGFGALTTSHTRASVSVAAVSALGCTHGANVFNSALFVFRPSMAQLEALLLRDRSFDRVGQACEVIFTDQSLMNAEFRGGCLNYGTRGHDACRDVEWARLPLSYNVNVQLYIALPEALKRGLDVAVIHFAGKYAKPWLPLAPLAPGANRSTERARERRVRHEWQRLCGPRSRAPAIGVESATAALA